MNKPLTARALALILAAVAALSAGLAIAVPVLAGVPARAGAAPHHVMHCSRPVRLGHSESLTRWQAQTGLNVPVTLYFVEQCDHGWTPNIAHLLNGDYGRDIFTARLPRGTRLWKPVLS